MIVIIILNGYLINVVQKNSSGLGYIAPKWGVTRRISKSRCTSAPENVFIFATMKNDAFCYI